MWVAVPISAVCLGVAAYLYWLAFATKKTRKQRATPLAFAVVLTALGLLVPVLALGVVRLATSKKPAIRNGVAPGTVLFASS